MNGLSNIQAKTSNHIFKSNITSLVSIYKDGEESRTSRLKEILSEFQKWSESNVGKEVEEVTMLPEGKMEEYNLYEYHFDYLLLNSLFISAFSLFEIHLKRLAKLAEQDSDSKVKLSDIKGNGEIDTIRKYLCIIHNITAADNNTNEWKEILEFKAIRNAIVHHGSVLNYEKRKNPDKIIGIKKIKEHNIWFSSESTYFRLKRVSFLEDFQNLTITYSDNITNQLANGS